MLEEKVLRVILKLALNIILELRQKNRAMIAHRPEKLKVFERVKTVV